MNRYTLACLDFELAIPSIVRSFKKLSLDEFKREIILYNIITYLNGTKLVFDEKTNFLSFYENGYYKTGLCLTLHPEYYT